MGSATTRSRSAGRTSGDRISRWTRRMADHVWAARALRAGMAARGVVYLGLAYLVAQIAAGALGRGGTGEPASGTGVAQAIVAQRGGRAALALLAVGLVLYAMFGVIDTVLHHDDETPGAKRWGDRALSAWGVVLYVAFAGYSISLAASGPTGGDHAAQGERRHTEWSAHVLDWPGGAVYLGVVGAALIVIGAFMVRRAVRRSFRPRLERRRMSQRVWRIAMISGTVGCLGRSGLFGLVGWFVLGAAIENDPRKGQGVDGAIRLFAAETGGVYGLWALVIALGAYALYLFIEARYRHV